MTETKKGESGQGRDGLASTSGELGLDLLGLRVNGAQLGTMLGVSRQAVSNAAKRGTISPPGHDGLFDAKRAVREWMANTDPARIRARALKPGAEMTIELREKVRELASEVQRLRDELTIESEWGEKREQAAALRAGDAADRALSAFTEALLSRFTEAVAAHAAGRLPRWLDELVVVAFYGQDLAEFRADFPEEEASGDAEPAA